MEKFSLNNQVEKVIRGENSNFLNPINVNYVVNRLKKMNKKYNVFYLYPDAEKLIVYSHKLEISLIEIKYTSNLTHKEILGSLFSHNLEEDVFGDIIIDNDRYYIVVLDKIKKYLFLNLNMIGKKRVKLVERNLSDVENFHNKYKNITLNTVSLRIDSIIAKLIPTSRTISNQYIIEQKVMVNYQILKNKNYLLKENDIFSIRGVGKFKFVNILTTTKTGKYQVLINKYI